MTLHTLVSPFGPHWDEHCRSNNMESITDCYRKKVQHNLEQVRAGPVYLQRREHGMGGLELGHYGPRDLQRCWSEEEHP